MNEEWRIVFVNGEPTQYLVSSLGGFSNSKRLMSNTTKGNKYISVTLRVNKKSIATRLHRLVAQCFIPNPDNLPQVNHKNGKKSDNAVSNLEWCTPKHNIIHSFEMGLIVRPKGQESHLYDKGCGILDTRTGDVYPSVATAARVLNIPRTTISAEINGFRKSKYGFVKL